MKVQFGRLALGALLSLALFTAAGCGGDAETKETTAGSGGSTKSGSSSATANKTSSTTGSSSTSANTPGTVGGSGSKSDSSTAGGGGSDTAKGPVLKVGETGTLGDVLFNLVKVETAPSSGQSASGAAKREHLLVHLKLQNAGGKSVAVSSLSTFKLEDPEGNLFTYSMQSAALRGAKLDGSLAAGQGRDGWAGFMVIPKAGDWVLVVRRPGQSSDLRFQFSYPG